MEWLLKYAPVLSMAASLLMLLVWVVYLNLFWLSYRRQLRANVVISRGAGAGRAPSRTSPSSAASPARRCSPSARGR